MVIGVNAEQSVDVDPCCRINQLILQQTLFDTSSDSLLQVIPSSPPLSLFLLASIIRLRMRLSSDEEELLSFSVSSPLSSRGLHRQRADNGGHSFLMRALTAPRGLSVLSV